MRKDSEMATLTDIIYYLISNYPHKDELSNARVTKMVYLADWHAAVKLGHQLTYIRWFFNNFGPFVTDVHSTILFSPELFTATHKENYFGGQKTLFAVKDNNYIPSISCEEKLIIDRVIEVTKDKTWDQFITFVYSTYPIVNSERYSQLDLVALAQEYKMKK